MDWMNDNEGTYEAALAGNACYICGSVVHVPDPKTGICPREAAWEKQSYENEQLEHERSVLGMYNDPTYEEISE